MSEQHPWTIREVSQQDDDAALALERRCPQGGSFKLLFKRDTFRARTEGFENALLLGAWRADRLIAVGGGAIKPVIWDGRDTRSLLLYDFRVDPEFRRAGVARSLAAQLIDWARPQAEIGIAYAIGDNQAVQSLAREWIGAGTAPAFDLLAFPASSGRANAALEEADAATVRARHVADVGGRSLISITDSALSSGQRAGSWVMGEDKRAGCSAWTTAGIIEEEVIGLPPILRAASYLLGGPTARRLKLPHVPRTGETLRSWLLFDLFAADGASASKAVSAVAALAQDVRIDHCHVVLPSGSPLVEAIRRGVPSMFAPVIPFSIMARTISGTPLNLGNPVIDPRDI